jgi:hypothetical protein
MDATGDAAVPAHQLMECEGRDQARFGPDHGGVRVCAGSYGARRKGG